MWNGIGGKIDETDDTPLDAMNRECLEETGIKLVPAEKFKHCITLVCPGGTFPVDYLPEKLMYNLRWIIPFCLSSVQMPIMVYQYDLGVEQ